MVPTPLSLREIARELADYEVVLAPAALEQISRYLELLLRWNRRINLTGIREPREIVRRLFGESLCLARVVALRGWLVDVGAGAGFPGLALKLAAPGLRVTLVESRGKKCAFLKEVVRSCNFSAVEVVKERFETWVQRQSGRDKADMITTRAVEMEEDLLRAGVKVLGPGGALVVQTTAAVGTRIRERGSGLAWAPLKPVPESADHIILVGTVS